MYDLSTARLDSQSRRKAQKAASAGASRDADEENASPNVPRSNARFDPLDTLVAASALSLLCDASGCL